MRQSLDNLKKQLDIWYRKRFKSESLAPSLNYLFDMLLEEGVNTESLLEEHIDNGSMEETIRRYYQKMKSVGEKQKQRTRIEVDY